MIAVPLWLEGLGSLQGHKVLGIKRGITQWYTSKGNDEDITEKYAVNK